MKEQKQFLQVVDRDVAEARFQEAVDLTSLEPERVGLSDSLGRVLATDVLSPVDVPSFDRSNFDGFAVQAKDTYGANEEHPVELKLYDETIATAVQPSSEVRSGTAIAIATGGMLPRGADAVVLVEHTEPTGDAIRISRAVNSGFGVTFTGTDIARQETVLRKQQLLTSRETGVLAAIGITEVDVVRRPRIAVYSTGDEIIAPGETMRPGFVYDSNARVIADAVRELGCEAVEMGIVRDDVAALRKSIHRALQECDGVLLSGGTSKGAGDLSYQVVAELDQPGIVAHGVALKPGKPICLAAHKGKPVVVLPGFPTSAVFTFHEFVAPVLSRLAGLSMEARQDIEASLAMKVRSEIGRTEYLLVGLVEANDERSRPPVAYPMGKGSGSVTTFGRADGFITMGRHEEIVDAGTNVSVRLLGRDVKPADLVVIGSHCLALDFLLSKMQEDGWTTKFIAVGSTGGLRAAERGECDLAGIHLLDPETDEYNRPFATSDLELVTGYVRQQVIAFRTDSPLDDTTDVDSFIEQVCRDELLMINRNQGSGTRILIDSLLGDRRPRGYGTQASNHNAVAAAITQRRADWGVTIQKISSENGLQSIPVRQEHFDFVVPKQRSDRAAVKAFQDLLQRPDVFEWLEENGFK